MTNTRRFRPSTATKSTSTHSGGIAGRFALVVSSSRVNTIVVSRTIADCGLKVVETNHDGVGGILRTSVPKLIVIDGQYEPNGVSDLLAALSQISAAPPVVFLANSSTGEVPDYPFRAIAKMPLTSDSFMPLIQSCI